MMVECVCGDRVCWWKCDFVVRTFHHTDSMCLCGRCLNPVRAYIEHDTISGGGILFNVMSMELAVVGECHH